MRCQKKHRPTISDLRSNLEAAEAALVATQSSLEEKEIELKQARLSLSETSSRLNESEKSISHLQENRSSTLSKRTKPKMKMRISGRAFFKS